MSRVGKYPVEVPQGVTVTIEGDVLSAKGKLGELKYVLSPELVDTKVEDNKVVVTPKATHKQARMMWGTTRARINNLVKGVSVGFSKTLDIVGVGYRASLQGSNLLLNLGMSHDIMYPIPAGITVKVPAPTQIEISGADKQVVGQIAAEIRSFRKPEPYKGKGVKYSTETILRKEGKKK